MTGLPRWLRGRHSSQASTARIVLDFQPSHHESVPDLRLCRVHLYMIWLITRSVVARLTGWHRVQINSVEAQRKPRVLEDPCEDR
jgi:hypothetical protein